MKHYKVIVHPKTFENSDLLLNPKDFPDLKIGDIVEIYHPEDELNRLLLQVTTFKEDLQAKDAISLEQSIASTFQLRTFSDVFINKVDYNSVVLDSVEVTFKDQYLGRSEMWRLKTHMMNTCVYLNKKIEFCGGTARVQVYEMWSQGEKVACGVITEGTKMVFRSSTSMVYLFLQMSSEMWEFDVHGDLYFEKAVNGFLADLFQKWKKHGSNHEVTIVLFSRVFYKAQNLEEFPEHMRECLQKDYKHQFYEDFYRVAVQNEKYDDWSSTLILLQSLFTEYCKNVLEYHKKPGCKIPKAFLSTAAHGNFLEVLNISLNVFEKHYLERSLDRTGQLSVVISPGVGVFEVDRELTNVTKQRIIDNGVGCDLVCVGEQPLHAVPLFKFHNKDANIMRDDYSMPHWMNLSFYSTNRKLAYSKFIPRIRLPSRRTESSNSQSSLVPNNLTSTSVTTCKEENPLLVCNISAVDTDYDEYDNNVFTLPSTHSSSVQKLFSRSKKHSICQESNKSTRWKLSDPDIYRSYLSSSCGTSSTNTLKSNVSNVTVPSRSSTTIFPRISSCYFDHEKFRNPEKATEDDAGCMFLTAATSVESSVSAFPQVTQKNSHGAFNTNGGVSSVLCPGKALINPFDPSHVTVKVTSNRRRWTHVFPKAKSGVVIQQHHYQPTTLFEETESSGKMYFSLGRDSASCLEEETASNGFCSASENLTYSKTSVSIGSPGSGVFLPTKKIQTLLWGATGEQPWTPVLMTGVDWKSLVVPACLPITTDYFPDEICLKTDYLFSDYNLLPDDVNADYARKRAIYRPPLKTREVFFELISQRLAQGFQLIVDSESNTNLNQNSCTVVQKRPSEDEHTEFKLSIGRIFHKLSLCKSEIRITRYRPRHPYPPFILQYRYRFQVPDHVTYSASWVSFNAEKLENFNWNYLDHYICTRGDTDFSLIESCKYWRFRLYALSSIQPGTKRILDGSANCDVYFRPSSEDKRSLLDGFLKFIESPVNKIKRIPTQKFQQKQDHLTNQLIHRRHSTGIVFLTRSQVGSGNTYSSPYRERLGSMTREKSFRPRSESKVSEKPRILSATDSIIPLAVTIDIDKENDVFDNSFKGVKMKEKEVVSNTELVEMMSHPQYGIGFLSVDPSLPSDTFISYDAVQWLKKNIDGISHEWEAVQQLEELRKDKLICHASGDFDHPFIFGFYLYYIPWKEDNKGEHVEPIRDLITFKNEWAEVETLFIFSNSIPCPVFFSDELPEPEDACSTSVLCSVPVYKQMHLEVDIGNKSDRTEWGHARYQSVYSVDQVFELVIEWVAASGPIVSDLIHSLARKAQSYNLQLIPVPADPHALPYALKSDPLRGPVFVPLDVACLLNGKNVLFEEFEEESRVRRLLLLQEEIAIQFGFILCKGSDSYQHHNQYVHLTGNIFLLIPSPLNSYWTGREYGMKFRSKDDKIENKSVSPKNTRDTLPQCDRNGPVVSPHQEYASRHVIDYYGDTNRTTENRVGYLWSWNHMIGRRWKGINAATNDEAFQDKLLLDFRNFCSNTNNRLRQFWDKCYSSK